MASPLHQPHDHLFRLVFADPGETAAFLRARLPDSHQRSILWSSLRRAAGSFIDQELRGSASDLLFEVRSAAAAPRQWLYLLFEHQSQPDCWIRRHGRLLRRHRTAHHGAPLGWRCACGRTAGWMEVVPVG